MVHRFGEDNSRWLQPLHVKIFRWALGTRASSGNPGGTCFSGPSLDPVAQVIGATRTPGTAAVLPFIIITLNDWQSDHHSRSRGIAIWRGR